MTGKSNARSRRIGAITPRSHTYTMYISYNEYANHTAGATKSRHRGNHLALTAVDHITTNSTKPIKIAVTGS